MPQQTSMHPELSFSDKVVIQTHNTTVIITPFVTILAKVIVVKTLMLEDAADIKDNMVNTLKAYSTKMYYRLL